MARRDPKVGTGKKPKGSGRRLYTDENPRDTVRIKFATPTDARKTVAKVKRVSKPFKVASMGAESFLKSGRCMNSHSLICFSIHSAIGM